MWVAAACNEPNIRTAPTAKRIATAKTNAWLDRMGCSPVLGGRIGGWPSGEPTRKMVQRTKTIAKSARILHKVYYAYYDMICALSQEIAPR